MATVKKESVQVSAYSRRLKDNVKSILDNYAEILKASKVTVDPQPTFIALYELFIIFKLLAFLKFLLPDYRDQ